MDQIKIGKFIAEMRKEQDMTQIDLAEALGVSNKTISKWECGNGMPDYAVMESLCEKLKINVNELLSGERLPSRDYNKKAEENMMELIQETNKKSLKWDLLITLICVLGIMAGFGLIMVSFGGVAAIHNFVDAPQLVFLVSILLLVLVMSGMIKDLFCAFRYAFKTDLQINVSEIKKAILAVKTAIITANVTGILFALIGTIISLQSGIDMDKEYLLLWIAVSMLSICYGLMISIILIPVYTRLKNKLIAE